MSRAPLSRRAVLRGAVQGAGAVALGLPLLEAMLPARARAEGAGLGPIFGVFFWANGLPWHDGHGSVQAGHPDHWTPATQGTGWAAPPLLAPLAAHLPTVLSGLEPKTEIPDTPAGQSDGHMRGFMVGLTSDRPRPEGFDHPSHTLTALRPTLDQVVAKDPRFYASYPSPYRSLEIGTSTARFHDYGHWNAISYNGPDSLNPAVSDPGRLYEMIFGISTGDGSQGRRAALLDAVLADAADLRGRLGAADRLRIDAHMEHLFEVQRRLSLGDISCTAPGAPGSSADLLTQTGIQADLLATGLACNITRVFSFMLTSPATTHVFSEVGVSQDMHTVCHAGDWDAIYAITLLQMRCFARFCDALAAQVDPLGTSLLERALIFGTSEYGEGYQHGNAETPVLLVGGADGRVRRGVHVRAPAGNLASAHLTLLRGLGLETPQFGFSGSETTIDFPQVLV